MTKIEIINMALELIGSSPITSIDTETPGDDKKAVRLCRRFYQHVYDQALRMHPWKCAKKRAELAQVEKPAFEWGYAYALPVDCLRVLQLQELDYEFMVEGRNLLTNISGAKILYIARVEPHLLDSWVVKVVYHMLALEIAYSITQNKNVVSMLRIALYGGEGDTGILVKAKHQSSTEELVPDWNKQKDSWIDSRYTGNIGPYS